MTKYKVLLQSENIDYVELNESLINDYLKIINDEEIQKRVSSKRRTFTYEEEFNKFFKDYEKVLLNEVIETRFNKQKNMWEFIYKNI